MRTVRGGIPEARPRTQSGEGRPRGPVSGVALRGDPAHNYATPRGEFKSQKFLARPEKPARVSAPLADGQRKPQVVHQKEQSSRSALRGPEPMPHGKDKGPAFEPRDIVLRRPPREESQTPPGIPDRLRHLIERLG